MDVPFVCSLARSMCARDSFRGPAQPSQWSANSQQLPSHPGRGLKQGIDTWLAAQAPVNLTSLQQVSFTRETPPHDLMTKYRPPPHSPPSIDSGMPSAHTNEVTGTHIVQVVSTGPAEEVSFSNKEDPFFHIFALKRKSTRTCDSRFGPRSHANHVPATYRQDACKRSQFEYPTSLSPCSTFSEYVLILDPLHDMTLMSHIPPSESM
jgi:hypothetical protein